MLARLPLRSPPLLLAAALLLGAASVVVLGTALPGAVSAPVLLVVGGLGAVGAAYLLWQVDPAWSISAGIALSIFSGNWDHLGLPGGVGLAPDRFVLALGILAALFRSPGARDRPPITSRPAYWALAAAAAYAIGSAIWAGTLVDEAGGFLLLDRFTIVGFVAFAVAPVAFATAQQRRILLTTLVVVGAYLGLTSLFETVGADALVVPKYILDPNIGFHPDRARGPFIEAEANGLALFACAVAAVIAATLWRRPAARATAVLVAALCTAGCLFTVSRAIWLGSILGVLIALLAFRELRRFVVPGIVIGALLVGGSFALIPGLLAKAERREANQLPVWARHNTNTAAVRMIGEKPMLGFGWSRYKPESLPYFWQDPNTPLFGTEAGVHNVVLLNAVELGLVGAALWLFAVLFAIGGAIVSRGPPELRPWRIGLLAIAIQFAVVLNLTPLVQVLPNVLLFLWAGLVLARPERQPAPAPARDPLGVTPQRRALPGGVAG